jgi:Domain of unknown function DUF83
LTYAESDLIPISALQHFVVCPRQCALIHLEGVWIESERTAEGRVEHERVDRGGTETRGPVRRGYGVPLRSLRLGLTGKADVVEFHTSPGGDPDRDCRLAGAQARRAPPPVSRRERTVGPLVAPAGAVVKAAHAGRSRRISALSVALG